MIFYLMGKSATGKDSIYKKLLSENFGLKEVTIYTTRPKRDGEVDGIEYYFVDENYFNNNKNRLIEKREYYTMYGKWYYATMDDGKINKDENYLMIGTLESYNSLKKYYGEDQIFPIYLHVDKDIRRERAIKREENQDEPKFEEMARRFLADEVDFKEKNIINAGIKKRYINDDLDRCFNEIKNDIRDVIDGKFSK